MRQVKSYLLQFIFVKHVRPKTLQRLTVSQIPQDIHEQLSGLVDRFKVVMRAYSSRTEFSDFFSMDGDNKHVYLNICSDVDLTNLFTNGKHLIVSHDYFLVFQNQRLLNECLFTRQSQSQSQSRQRNRQGSSKSTTQRQGRRQSKQSTETPGERKGGIEQRIQSPGETKQKSGTLRKKRAQRGQKPPLQAKDLSLEFQHQQKLHTSKQQSSGKSKHRSGKLTQPKGPREQKLPPRANDLSLASQKQQILQISKQRKHQTAKQQSFAKKIRRRSSEWWKNLRTKR